MAKTEKNIALTDIQRAVLNAAACSSNLVAWPLPRTLGLNAGSEANVVRALLRKGLLEKRSALGADAVWKEEEDTRFTLVITKAGLTAAGMYPAGDPAQKADDKAKHEPTAPVSDSQRRMPRPGSKLAMLVALLSRTEGATVEEMSAATGWQAHTIRGAMSGALTKKFEMRIVSEKVEGRGRVYRAVGGSARGSDKVGSTGE